MSRSAPKPHAVRTVPNDVARAILEAFAKEHAALIRELAKR